MQAIVRASEIQDREWISDLLTREWGSSLIVTRGRIHEACALPAWIASRADRRVGLLTYRIEQDECEIVSLNSLMPGVGVANALLLALAETCVKRRCKRIWLITTNDNLGALGFYQRRGFRLVAVHRNAIEVSRRLKPSIPAVGANGIPIRDEVELEVEAAALASACGAKIRDTRSS